MELETVTQASNVGNVPEPLTHVKRLAVFAPNWLGDAVMSLPALADVRRALPSAQIEIIARRPVAPLFSLVPGVDHVMLLPAKGLERRDGLSAIGRRQFDAAILLPNSFQAAWAAWRAGIPERWGYRTDWRGALLTRTVTRPASGHQAAYYQRLVAGLGFQSGPLKPHLSVPEAAREAARQKLVTAGWDEKAPLVAMAPGAAYGGAKRWPAESFAALATILSRDAVAVVLVGTEADGEAADRVKRGAAVVPIDLVGQTDLSSLAGVLLKSRALVTNDSGAMHVAAAVGIPVVAMFGPTREYETAPIGDAQPTILTSDVWCRPCMLRECPLDHRCMRGIDVDMVVSATRRHLEKR